MAVSQQQIERFAHYLDHLEKEEDWEMIFGKFGSEQAVLLTFLLEMGEADFDETEQEVLLDYGLFCWYVLDQSYQQIPSISADQLESVQQINQPLLERLHPDDLNTFEQHFDQLINQHKEPFLLKYLKEMILEKETDMIRDENQHIMLLFLKVLVDSLLES